MSRLGKAFSTRTVIACILVIAAGSGAGYKDRSPSRRATTCERIALRTRALRSGCGLAPPLRLIPTASRVADHGQMGQRSVFVVTWLAGTALATAVGFAAITTVGDMIRDAGPLGVEFRAPPPAIDAPVGLPHQRTFETPEAVVSAECTAGSPVCSTSAHWTAGASPTPSSDPMRTWTSTSPAPGRHPAPRGLLRRGRMAPACHRMAIVWPHYSRMTGAGDKRATAPSVKRAGPGNGSALLTFTFDGAPLIALW
jgi:hypothetical protein